MYKYFGMKYNKQDNFNQVQFLYNCQKLQANKQCTLRYFSPDYFSFEQVIIAVRFLSDLLSYVGFDVENGSLGFGTKSTVTVHNGQTDVKNQSGCCGNVNHCTDWSWLMFAMCKYCWQRHHLAQTHSIINTQGCDILANLSTPVSLFGLICIFNSELDPQSAVWEKYGWLEKIWLIFGLAELSRKLKNGANIQLITNIAAKIWLITNNFDWAVESKLNWLPTWVMYMLSLNVSLLLQNLHPSVITRSFQITRILTANNTLVTYWSCRFHCIIRISIFFPQIFGRQKFGGKFGYSECYHFCVIH